MTGCGSNCVSRVTSMRSIALSSLGSLVGMWKISYTTAADAGDAGMRTPDAESIRRTASIRSERIADPRVEWGSVRDVPIVLPPNRRRLAGEPAVRAGPAEIGPQQYTRSVIVLGGGREMRRTRCRS